MAIQERGNTNRRALFEQYVPIVCYSQHNINSHECGFMSLSVFEGRRERGDNLRQVIAGISTRSVLNLHKTRLHPRTQISKLLGLLF